MKVRSLTDIVTVMDTELGWRKRELQYISTQVARLESNAQATAIRGGIALLYAHWEGFIVAALRAYVDFVSSKRVLFDQLSYELRAGVLRSSFSNVEAAKCASARANFLRDWKSKAGLPCKFNATKWITAESNLNSSRFLGLVAVVGLDEAQFSTAAKFLDESLVARRNSICHGERLELDSVGYLSVEEQVVALMEAVKTVIVNAAVSSTYLA